MNVARDIRRVVRRGNCSGCGACASLFQGVKMRIDEDGYARPEIDESVVPTDRASNAQFRRVCPGVIVSSVPSAGSKRHEVFGDYVQAWSGYATATDVRMAGSSGGVLTALSVWLLASGRAIAGQAVASGASPSRSVPVRIVSRDEALRAAGSRYAPVAALENADDRTAQDFIVGKPCEAAAARAIHRDADPEAQPIILSFFCAGTPSQWSTNRLISEVGVARERLQSLRYRGDGWPGDFVVTDIDGNVGRKNYDESWGRVLGRSVQPRCKVCVDGTGELSDISVGDYWETDERGYPLFAEGDGNSVVIARTPLGRDVLLQAEREGVIVLAAVDLDDVAKVQPLQAERRYSLLGRMAGRFLTGRPAPRYRGFTLTLTAVRHPKSFVRGVVGIIVRRRASMRTLSRLRQYSDYSSQTETGFDG